MEAQVGHEAGPRGSEPTNPESEFATAGPIASILSIRPAEVATVKRIFVSAFILGLALVAFYGGANALFLTRYEIEFLPWVYIVNAALVIVVGLLYNVASRRWSTTTTLLTSTTLSAVSVFALWVWALASDGDSVAFALATWNRLLWIFALLTLWEVASAVFDIRQSKRLFPAVGLGVMVAFVVGGAATGPVTALIGTTNLILVSAIFFLLYSVSYARLMAVEKIATDPDDAPPAGPRTILSDRYSRLLALMRSIVILLVYVCDFVFYEQAAATFDSEESLATFLGAFIAVSTLVMVVFSAVAAARYIAFVGIRAGLATMPAVVAVAAILAGLWGWIIGVNTGFFVLVVITQLLNIVSANAVEPPVGAVTFQPLPAERRMSVRLAVDGWLGSFALLLAGVLLLLFEVLNFASVVPFVWLLALIGLAGIVVAGLVHRGYTEALQDATTRSFGGDHTLGSLIAGLADDSLAPSRLGLGASTAIDVSDEASLFAALLEHPDPSIAELAVESLELGATADELPQLTGSLSAVVARTDLPDAARGRALGVLSTIDSAQAASLAESLAPAPAGTGSVLAGASLGARLTHRGDDSIARTELSALIVGDVADDRLCAATALGAMRGPTLQAETTALIADDDATVGAAALEAISGRVPAELVPAVLDAGQAPARRRPALRALSHSPDTFDAIQDRFDDLSLDYRCDLVSQVFPTLTRRPAVLHRFVEPGSPSQLREAGFEAIGRTGIMAPATVDRMTRDDVALARSLVEAYRDVAADAPELGHALAAEFDAARATIFSALALDYPPERIADIRALTRRASDDDRANAVEALDVLLSPELRRRLVPIIEPQTIADAVEQLTGLGEARDPTDWIVQLGDDQRLHDWTRRTAAVYQEAPNRESQPSMTREDPAAQQKVPMTDMISRIAALRGVDIFSTLPYPLLADLAEFVIENEFDAGETVIVEGDIDQDLFALTTGQVVVSSSTAPDVTLEAGTVFGELAVLSPAPRSATVTAVTACTALRVERETLLALVDRRPEVMVEIAGVLARRLRAG